MAYIVPSDISRLALSGAQSSEIKTLRVLKASLPDDYTVFHGVHWTREYHSWTHFGEIDFVVLNQSGDLLFIEQKNGALSEGEGGLEKNYGDSSKNPVQQINRSMDKVREKFQWQHGKKRRLIVDYVVYLPDYRVKDLNAAGLDASRIVDAAHRGELSTRIQEILGPGVKPNDGWYDMVHNFFCQTFEVVPDMQAHSDSNKRSYVRQVGPVAAVLANLEMTPYRLRFTGTAGSGKSLVARNFFERVTNEGKRVLLICFNSLLAHRFKNRVPEGGYVNTFHGLLVEFLESKGQVIDFSDPSVWGLLPDRVMNEQIPDEWLFDVLVVDEGQDVEQDWIDTLGLFLRKDADILWLEDPGQNLRGKPLATTDGFARYRCIDNYRSPELIARFIHNTLSYEFDLGNDLPGMGVSVKVYENPDEQPKIVTKIVQELKRRGISPEDIAIITCLQTKDSVFNKLEKVAGIKLRKKIGFDDEKNEVFSDGPLTFESIYRFKGLESPAIILVDIDPQKDRLDHWERLLYCGMTRATIRLDLVVQADNPENRRFLNA